MAFPRLPHHRNYCKVQTESNPKTNPTRKVHRDPKISTKTTKTTKRATKSNPEPERKLKKQQISNGNEQEHNHVSKRGENQVDLPGMPTTPSGEQRPRNSAKPTSNYQNIVQSINIIQETERALRQMNITKFLSNQTTSPTPDESIETAST